MRVLDTTTPTLPSPNTAAEISPLDPGNRISIASAAVMHPSRLVGLWSAVDVLAVVRGSSSFPPQPVTAAVSTTATATGHVALNMRFMLPEPAAPGPHRSHERRQHSDQGRDRLSEGASPQSPLRDEEHEACHNHAAAGAEGQRPSSRLVPG